MNKNLSYNFALENNAFFHFNIFMNEVREGKVKEDGTNELLNLIDRHVINDPDRQFYKSLHVGTLLYRARAVGSVDSDKGISIDSKDLTHGFDEANSREAPLGFGQSGRNSISGVSYLYVANREETACVEIKPAIRSIISLATFRVSKEVQIIDFSNDKSFKVEESEKDNVALAPLFTLIMRQFFVPVTDSDGYKATQMITDHLRKTGVDGIAYRSFYDDKGTNYTIFNSNRDCFEFIDSKLLVFQSERMTFLDFNGHKTIEAKTMGLAKYSEDDAGETLGKIKKMYCN